MHLPRLVWLIVMSTAWIILIVSVTVSENFCLIKKRSDIACALYIFASRNTDSSHVNFTSRTGQWGGNRKSLSRRPVCVKRCIRRRSSACVQFIFVCAPSFIVVSSHFPRTVEYSRYISHNMRVLQICFSNSEVRGILLQDILRNYLQNIIFLPYHTHNYAK